MEAEVPKEPPLKNSKKRRFHQEIYVFRKLDREPARFSNKSNIKCSSIMGTIPAARGYHEGNYMKELKLHKIELEKSFNPRSFEDRIYTQWQEQGIAWRRSKKEIKEWI